MGWERSLGADGAGVLGQSQPVQRTGLAPAGSRQPLVLDTAGAYLDQVTTSFADYLGPYQASWAKTPRNKPSLYGPCHLTLLLCPTNHLHRGQM
ncbi:hypothetical protein M011DRAFT_465283 [Sporormia fimetaria CBS 119925]|uniref:Uncharacterized protein n=1 Tax=Sporormia fimetaria CBS 119925 TaxID=1340428 RepID=A0A6A6VKF3_9PLEO|nr:hypothetical protein M011DRAFT_465283 [Sporormia fimetaria CBS 119925]